jgi:hypothetical protein
MFKTAEEAEIIRKHKEAEFRKIFVSALSKVCKLNLKNISVQLEFQKDCMQENVFRVTIFDKENTWNKTFSFYFFDQISDIKHDIDFLLKKIKKDNVKLFQE